LRGEGGGEEGRGAHPSRDLAFCQREGGRREREKGKGGGGPCSLILMSFILHFQAELNHPGHRVVQEKKEGGEEERRLSSTTLQYFNKFCCHAQFAGRTASGIIRQGGEKRGGGEGNRSLCVDSSTSSLHQGRTTRFDDRRYYQKGGRGRKACSIDTGVLPVPSSVDSVVHGNTS